MSDSTTLKQSYTLSRRQIEALVSKAGKEAVDHALIQNGNAPEAFRDYSISRPQLAKLIEKVGKEAVDRALIQNGNEPEAFSTKK